MPCFACGDTHHAPEWGRVPDVNVQLLHKTDVKKFTWWDGVWYFYVCTQCREEHGIMEEQGWFLRQIHENNFCWHCPVPRKPGFASHAQGPGGAGYVELQPQFQWTAEILCAELAQVPGVLAANCETDERTIWVTCQPTGLAQSVVLKFVVVRSDQPIPGGQPSVCVCFKKALACLYSEAWRILDHVTRGKALFPSLVERSVANSPLRA